MEAIARRAKVSKETLYRWWHSKTEVVLDALAERGQQTIHLPDTGTLRGDLRDFLRATVDSADPATVRLLRGIAAAAAADKGAALLIRDRFLAARRADLGQILRRSVARARSAATAPPWRWTSSTAPCGTGSSSASAHWTTNGRTR